MINPAGGFICDFCGAIFKCCHSNETCSDAAKMKGWGYLPSTGYGRKIFCPKCDPKKGTQQDEPVRKMVMTESGAHEIKESGQ